MMWWEYEVCLAKRELRKRSVVFVDSVRVVDTWLQGRSVPGYF